jgi:hypothetical protein
MANPGFNIKVRIVENGYTVHVSNIGSDGRESHQDFIADEKAVENLLGDTIRRLLKQLKIKARVKGKNGD